MKTKHISPRLFSSLVVYVCFVALTHGDSTNITVIQHGPVTNAITPWGVIESTDETVLLALTAKPEKGWVMRLVGNSEFRSSRQEDTSTDVRFGEDRFTFPSMASFRIRDNVINVSFRIAAAYPRGDVFEPIKEGVGLYICLWSPFALARK